MLDVDITTTGTVCALPFPLAQATCTIGIYSFSSKLIDNILKITNESEHVAHLVRALTPDMCRAEHAFYLSHGNNPRL